MPDEMPPPQNKHVEFLEREITLASRDMLVSTARLTGLMDARGEIVRLDAEVKRLVPFEEVYNRMRLSPART